MKRFALFAALGLSVLAPGAPAWAQNTPAGDIESVPAVAARAEAGGRLPAVKSMIEPTEAPSLTCLHVGRRPRTAGIRRKRSRR